MEDKITITKKHYLELIIDSEKLDRLECGGVDNWEWFGESMNPDDRLELDEFEEEEKFRISKL